MYQSYSHVICIVPFDILSYAHQVFTARLIGTGNMVLIHPMEEAGQVFLPVCYGYATTVRRAQGADLYQGCIYMDQKKRAGRGYGYVAVSRFMFRTNVYLDLAN